MRERVFTVVLAFLLMAGLTACGGSDGGSEKQGKDTETAESAAKEQGKPQKMTQEEIAQSMEGASKRTIDGEYETYVWTQYEGHWGYFQNSDDNTDIVSLKNLAISEEHPEYTCRGNYPGRDDFIYYDANNSGKLCDGGRSYGEKIYV